MISTLCCFCVANKKHASNAFIFGFRFIPIFPKTECVQQNNGILLNNERTLDAWIRISVWYKVGKLAVKMKFYHQPIKAFSNWNLQVKLLGSTFSVSLSRFYSSQQLMAIWRYHTRLTLSNDKLNFWFSRANLKMGGGKKSNRFRLIVYVWFPGKAIGIPKFEME